MQTWFSTHRCTMDTQARVMCCGPVSLSRPLPHCPFMALSEASVSYLLAHVNCLYVWTQTDAHSTESPTMVQGNSGILMFHYSVVSTSPYSFHN